MVMKRYFQQMALISAVLFGVLIGAGGMRAQNPATPPLPPAAGALAAPARGGQRGAAAPGSETGWSTFQARCSSCHLNPNDKAPTGVKLREMTPEKIYASLTTGTMQMQSEGLNDGI